MNQTGWSSNFRLHLFVVTSLITFIVSLTFFNFRFPGDGAYYHALSDHLLSTGSLKDVTVIPHSPVITRQNGIVFFIASIKYIFGKLWWVAYIAVVTVLWTVFVTKMHLTVCLIIKETKTLRFFSLSILISYIPLLHYNSILSIGGFINESIFLPLIWILFLDCFNVLHSPDSFSKSKFFKELEVEAILIGLFVVMFGVIFRIQSITYILAIFAGLAFCRLISCRMFFAIFAVPLLVFLILSHYQYSSTSDRILAEILSIRDLPFNNVFRFFSQLASPISLISVAPPRGFLAGSIVSLGVICFASILSILGLIAVFKRSRALCLTFSLLILLNGLFLIVLPMHSSRYEHILTVPVLLLYLYGLTCFWHSLSLRKIQILSFFFVLGSTGLVAGYAENYFKGSDSSTTFFKIRGYVSALDRVKSQSNFIIYSEEPRYTYWYSGLASCSVAPPECFSANSLTSDDDIYYVGSKEFFTEHRLLIGYERVENGGAINDISGGGDIDVWKVSKIQSR